MAGIEKAAVVLDELARKRREAGFPFVWCADATPRLDHVELVKGLIADKSLTLIYGPSGSGKSFFTIDLALHIACGLPWRGRKVRQSLGVYVASEAGESILKRFSTARDRLLGEAHEGTIPLAILTRGPNLLGIADVDRLIEQLRDLALQAKLPLGIVIFDTLSRSIPGGDENKSEDMTRVIECADRIRDELKAGAMIVHHCGKDVTRGLRGHSSLFAAADTVLAVVDKSATVEKIRDGIAGEEFPFKLDVVELGTDADGDPVTTCILSATATAPGKRKPARLSGPGTIGLQALREAIDEHGNRMPETSAIPAGVRAVTIDRWRSQFRLRYGTGDDGEARDQGTIRKAFLRCRDDLFKSNLVAVSDPFCWLRP